MPQSIVRKPRARVTANGIAIRWRRIEAVNNNNHHSDSFVVTLPLFDPTAAVDWTWWAAQPDIEIEIAVGFEDERGAIGQLSTILVGPADKIELVPYPRQSGDRGIADGRGAFLEIHGGDYSRALMNSPITSEQIGRNLTSAQIIGNIAANHPQISLQIPSQGAGVGTPYDQMSGRLFLHRSEWDVLTALADHEGWRARMVGKTLIIGPPQSGDASAPYPVIYVPSSAGQGIQSNVMFLRLAHAANIALGIDAIVEAHDAVSGTQVRAKASSSGSSTNTGGRTTYTFNHPGMTQEQANQSAQSHAGQIALFEREIEFAMPGDPTLNVAQTIALSGTGTAFDQTYPIDHITHLLDMHHGYEMQVLARNFSTPGLLADLTIPVTPVPGAPPLKNAP